MLLCSWVRVVAYLDIMILGYLLLTTFSKTGDYNGDVIIDILWRKGSANYLWYMQADGSHTYKKISGKGTSYSVQ